MKIIPYKAGGKDETRLDEALSLVKKEIGL
jgi:hypothetical protein